ncbi:hypothetical protein Q5752_000985 [Cryptotrichosporon argae]
MFDYSAVKVLLLGSTGFLGGTVLTHLENAGFTVTCLVREGKVGLLEGRKAHAIAGTYDDHPALTTIAAAHDVVVNAATSDDLGLTVALNRGLAQRRTAGKTAVLAHVSGSQVIESKPTGKLEPVPVYNDEDVKQIEGISEDALHRKIDLEIVRADLAGEIIASIICPTCIWGKGSGPDKVISGMNPDYVKVAIKKGYAAYAGEGTNIWGQVEVDDVADLIVRVIKRDLTVNQPAGFARWYFAENGERDAKTFATTLGATLHRLGLISDPAPQSVPVDDKEGPCWPNKTTSRCHANRSHHELGWNPKGKWDEGMEKDILDIVHVLKLRT